MFAVFWQNVSRRLIQLRFKRPEKPFQEKNQKNEAIILILWILSEIYLSAIKIRQICQVFILLAWRNISKKKLSESKT